MLMTNVLTGITGPDVQPATLGTPSPTANALSPQALRDMLIPHIHLFLAQTVFSEKLRSMEFVAKLMISAIPGVIQPLNVPHVMVVIGLPKMENVLLNDSAISFISQYFLFKKMNKK